MNKTSMQLGMIGLGRMGANMVRRCIRDGHTCVVFDRSAQAVSDLTKEKAFGAASLQEFVGKLAKPRAVWLMVPAAAVDRAIADLLPFLEAGDTVIDGGNSYYVDDIRRAKELAPKEIHYVDVGTSGGVWGLERGYCMMIGGEKPTIDAPRSHLCELGAGARRGRAHSGAREARRHLRARILALRPERRRPLREDGPQRDRVRPHGGLRRGLGILRDANIGKQDHAIDAETTPLRDPEHYQYDFNLADVTEVWRRGSVIASWLLDLTASALAARSPTIAVRGAGRRLRRRALDDQGGDRRRGAGAGARLRAPLALLLARPGRLPK